MKDFHFYCNLGRNKWEVLSPCQLKISTNGHHEEFTKLHYEDNDAIIRLSHQWLVLTKTL